MTSGPQLPQVPGHDTYCALPLSSTEEYLVAAVRFRKPRSAANFQATSRESLGNIRLQDAHSAKAYLHTFGQLNVLLFISQRVVALRHTTPVSCPQLFFE